MRRSWSGRAERLPGRIAEAGRCGAGSRDTAAGGPGAAGLAALRRHGAEDGRHNL